MSATLAPRVERQPIMSAQKAEPPQKEEINSQPHQHGKKYQTLLKETRASSSLMALQLCRPSETTSAGPGTGVRTPASPLLHLHMMVSLLQSSDL